MVCLAGANPLPLKEAFGELSSPDTCHSDQMNVESTTPLADFTQLLLEEGRALTRGDLHLQRASEADREATAMFLVTANEQAVWDAPFAPPSFNVEVAVWSAEAFAWACGMLIDRAETDTAVPDWLAKKVPQPNDPSHHWSVDLVFRFGRDLFQRSARLAEEDAFHKHLSDLLSAWPLACVGTPIENPNASIGVLTQHPCLRTLFIERIVLVRDSERAAIEQLADEFSTLIGAHPALGIQ